MIRQRASEAARPAVIAVAVLVATQVAGKATRDALFLSSFEPSMLPRMTGAAALVSLFATFTFARLMASLSPGRLLPAALGVSGVLFLLEWPLALGAPRVAAVLVFLHYAVLGALLISGFWGLVTERFDPHTSKRAMGALGTGASLGGVAGGLLAWQAARVVSLPAMLPVLAGASLLGLMSVRRLKPAHPVHERPVAATSSPGWGLRLIAREPYLRRLAALVGLTAFLEALLDYLLGSAAAASFARGAPLMSFFALFHAGAGFLALVTQATLVRPMLERLGLGGTLALQPLFSTLAAGLALAFPRLVTVVLLRGGETVLRNSAFRSSYELLYTPLPPETKRPTKVILDVACDRAGTIAGSAVVIVALALVPLASTRLLLALAVLVALAALVLAPRLQRGYVSALAASLRTGAGALEPPAVVDPTTLLTLASVHQDLLGSPPAQARAGGGAPDPLLAAAADLRSGDAGRVRSVLRGGPLDPRLVSHVIPLLADDRLFAAVVDALRRAAERCTGQLVDALLDPRWDPVVRRRVARVLKAVPTQRAADGLLAGLGDERFDVRYRCAQALEHVRAQDGAVVLPRARLLEVALREAGQAGRSARHLEHVFVLLGLLGEKAALENALRALRQGDQALRGTALEYLDNVLSAPLRDALWPHLAVGQRPAPSGRSVQEIRDDLLRSSASLPPPLRSRSG